MFERNEFMSLPDKRSLFLRVFSPVMAKNEEKELKGVVLVIHGLGEHSGLYKELAAKICEEGLLCAAFDLQGHGRTAKSGEPERGDALSFDSLILDTLYMMTNILDILGLAHKQNASLGVIGQGFGANLACFASSYLNRLSPPLFLSSPYFKLKMKQTSWEDQIKDKIKALLPYPLMPVGEKGEGEEDPLRFSMMTPRLAHVVQKATYDQTLIPVIQNIKAQVIVTVGLLDETTDLDFTKSMIPHLTHPASRFYAVEEGRHSPLENEESPKNQFFVRVSDWLKILKTDIPSFK